MNPQMDKANQEKALYNKQETLEFLKLKGRERDFLKIGELLTECEDKRYWDALGYTNFKDYVQTEFGNKGMSYSYATRFIKVYKYFNSLEGQSKDFTNMNLSTLIRLVEKERKGEVKPALWSKARTLTWKQLLGALGHKGGESMPLTEDEASMHTKIKEEIEKLGRMLGKYAEAEYDYPSKEYTCDIVWKESKQAPRATHVFEIQHRGGLDRAIMSLSYAFMTLNNPRPVLVVTTEEDGTKAKHRVRIIFPEMEKDFTVLSATEIDRLYSSLSRVQAIIEQLKPFI